MRADVGARDRRGGRPRAAAPHRRVLHASRHDATGAGARCSSAASASRSRSSSSRSPSRAGTISGFGLLVASYVLHRRVLRAQPRAARHGASCSSASRATPSVITVNQGMPVDVPPDWQAKAWVEPTMKHHPQDSRRPAAVPRRHHRAARAVRRRDQLRRPHPRGRPLRRHLPREPQARRQPRPPTNGTTVDPANDRPLDASPSPRRRHRGTGRGDDRRADGSGAGVGAVADCALERAQHALVVDVARRGPQRLEARPSAACRRRRSARRTRSRVGAPARRAGGRASSLSPATMSPAPASGRISRNMLLVTAAT